MLPGLGGTTALALLTPVTYGLEPVAALALAGGVMGGVPMGGAVTAILLNTPGQTANAVTCLDGYPLAQQGKAGLAIGAAASANAIGGIIGTISVLAVLPIATDLVLAFGPPEFFLIALLGLVLVATTTRGKMLRALVAGVFGLMIASIGYNDVTGGQRFTLGVEYLWDGVASGARARRPLRRRRDDASLDQGRHDRQGRQQHPDHQYRRRPVRGLPALGHDHTRLADRNGRSAPFPASASPSPRSSPTA